MESLSKMSRHRCTVDLYKAFLQASSIRYSGVALSEVSPTDLSHDSISRWLSATRYRPHTIWGLNPNRVKSYSKANLLVTCQTKHSVNLMYTLK